MSNDLRDSIRLVLEREFGTFLAHDPHDPDRFYGSVADAVLDALRSDPHGPDCLVCLDTGYRDGVAAAQQWAHEPESAGDDTAATAPNDDLTHLFVTTRHPTDYALHNEADGTTWRGTDEGSWAREQTAPSGTPTEPPEHVVEAVAKWLDLSSWLTLALDGRRPSTPLDSDLLALRDWIDAGATGEPPWPTDPEPADPLPIHEYDWVTIDPDHDTLHHVTLNDLQAQRLEHDGYLHTGIIHDGYLHARIITTCRRRAYTIHIPGLFTRLDTPRCETCCDAFGYPHGTGSPKNDDTIRELLGLPQTGQETDPA